MSACVCKLKTAYRGSTSISALPAIEGRRKRRRCFRKSARRYDGRVGVISFGNALGSAIVQQLMSTPGERKQQQQLADQVRQAAGAELVALNAAQTPTSPTDGVVTLAYPADSLNPIGGHEIAISPTSTEPVLFASAATPTPMAMALAVNEATDEAGPPGWLIGGTAFALGAAMTLKNNPELVGNAWNSFTSWFEAGQPGPTSESFPAAAPLPSTDGGYVADPRSGQAGILAFPAAQQLPSTEGGFQIDVLPPALEGYQGANDTGGGSPLVMLATNGDVESYVAGLQSKTTPTSTNAGLFEVEQTGPLNYRVTGGGTAIDIDGYNGTTMLDAKYVGDPTISPYVDDSTIPPFLRAKISAQQQYEFERYQAVINDPAVPFDSLNILTNEPSATSYFQRLMDQYQIPGEVKVVETNVPQTGPSSP